MCVEEDEPDLTYLQMRVAEYQRQLKEFVDWFIIKYQRLLEKRCKIAALRNGCFDIWEDLQVECFSECYAIAQRFVPTKGNLLTFLISSLWNYPFRQDLIAKYRPNSIQRDDEAIDLTLDEIPSHYANSRHLPVHCFDRITEPLSEDERILLSLHFNLGLANTTVAKLLVCSESTIRHRLEVLMTKLKRFHYHNNTEDVYYPDMN